MVDGSNGRVMVVAIGLRGNTDTCYSYTYVVNSGASTGWELWHRVAGKEMTETFINTSIIFPVGAAASLYEAYSQLGRKNKTKRKKVK